MGFFGALGRMIQGKPVFEAPSQQPPQTPHQAGEVSNGHPAQPQVAEPSGPKMYPQVYIERAETHSASSNMDVDFYIKNYSQSSAELDRLELFNHSQDLGMFLRPGEEREFRVYSGLRPTTTNLTRVVLHFKDQTGDWFQSEHTIEFKQEPDHTFTINRIRFLRVDDV